MVYWNTSWAPYGDIISGAPIEANASAWTEESLSTPVGARIAMKNETHTLIESLPDYAETTITTWIDKDTGILLKVTDVVDILSTGSIDLTSTTTIELTNADFFGIWGFLMYYKLFGISLLYILIGVVVLKLRIWSDHIGSRRKILDIIDGKRISFSSLMRSCYQVHYGSI